MSHSEAPISITIKTPAGSLVTVRASNGEELDQTVANGLDSIVSATQELESHVRKIGPTPVMSAAAVAAAIGGSVIETGNTIPAQEYTQPITGGRNCPHGRMTAIQGMGKDGKPYKGYFCPAPKGAFDKCKNQYINMASSEWNSFVPEQVK
jgi:hypothetical protein